LFCCWLTFWSSLANFDYEWVDLLERFDHAHWLYFAPWYSSGPLLTPELIWHLTKELESCIRGWHFVDQLLEQFRFSNCAFVIAKKKASSRSLFLCSLLIFFKGHLLPFLRIDSIRDQRGRKPNTFLSS
jgi:hypothetical protein